MQVLPMATTLFIVYTQSGRTSFWAIHSKYGLSVRQANVLDPSSVGPIILLRAVRIP